MKCMTRRTTVSDINVNITLMCFITMIVMIMTMTTLISKTILPIIMMILIIIIMKPWIYNSKDELSNIYNLR